MPFGGLLTVGLISAGANIGGAIIGSRAANKAADQQVASADAAKAELRPIYEANVARMNPYASLGLSALGKAGDLQGLSFNASTSPNVVHAGAVGRDAQGNPLGPSSGPLHMSDPRVQHLARGGSMADFPTTAGPAPTSLSVLGGGGRSAYGQPATGHAVPRADGRSSFTTHQMVRMVAPDGEERDVPAQYAAQLEQAGARRL